MEDTLTDRTFWKNYWQSKPNLIFTIAKNYELGPLVETVIKNKAIKTAIELGGFPGYYAVWLKKYFNINCTLLDYFADEEIIGRLSTKNGLSKNDVPIIETDLFNYTPENKYDLVLSCGLIEHFNDTKDIIVRHVQFLNEGGTLLITIPNFTGVNGWVQRKFDLENYHKHNIGCMDPKLLATICNQLGLKNIRSEYYGKYSVWLENKQQKPLAVKAFVKAIWFAGKIFTKIIPIESRALSPYIVLTATK